jgi:hypothetical protein
MIDVRVRFSVESEEEHLGPEFAATVIAATVRDSLCAQGFEPEKGVTVTVTPRGARVHTTIAT